MRRRGFNQKNIGKNAGHHFSEGRGGWGLPGRIIKWVWPFNVLWRLPDRSKTLQGRTHFMFFTVFFGLTSVASFLYVCVCGVHMFFKCVPLNRSLRGFCIGFCCILLQPFPHITIALFIACYMFIAYLFRASLLHMFIAYLYCLSLLRYL